MIACDLLGHDKGQLTVAFLGRTPLELFPREEIARPFLAAAGAPPPRSSGGSFFVEYLWQALPVSVLVFTAQNCLCLIMYETKAEQRLLLRSSVLPFHDLN